MEVGAEVQMLALGLERKGWVAGDRISGRMGHLLNLRGLLWLLWCDLE